MQAKREEPKKKRVQPRRLGGTSINERLFEKTQFTAKARAPSEGK